MSWNYPGAVPPLGYGGFPGGGPPGLGPPPAGMHAAPGVGPAPGMQQAHQAPGSAGFPANFNPATQMPNVDFSAPVIRLGTAGPSKPDTPGATGRNNERGDSGRTRGAGLGFDRGRDGGGRQESIAIAQPTREEIARTIFVGNITKAMGTEDDLQQLLNAAGGLRRWTRALDIDGMPCSFGFAEYEDADSLAIAADILQGVEIPTKKATQTNGTSKKTEDGSNGTIKKEEDADIKSEGDEKADKVKTEDGEDEQKPSFDKLLVVIDENSEKYIEDWRSRGALKEPAEQQFLKNSAKEVLANIIANLARTNLGETNGMAKKDGDGDVKMETDAFTGEVVNITIPQGEDELSEIPPEMRETVAKEIAAFRDRSVRRDLERLRREEELEAAEKRRSTEGSRINRLATPPPTNNDVPIGPRGVPQGPRANHGVQIPSDYRNGVAFVNGSNNTNYFTAEEEESGLTDEQIEEQRQRKRTEELEKMYLDQERRWLARERQRTAALEREKTRATTEAVKAQQAKEDAAERLRNWNDDEEAARQKEEYYIDRPLWARSRKAFRDLEAKQDEQDRATEARETQRAQEQHRRDMGMADDFLAQAAQEFGDRLPAANQPAARFKMSLGAAASQRQEAAAKGQRRTVAEVEGLLEDEEEVAGAGARRTLVPLSAEQLAATASLTDEERQQAQKDLAAAIPSDAKGLWAWNVPWEHVSESMIAKDLRPFVEKKIVEYLGVQEEMVVDVAVNAIRNRGKPQELVAELEGALDEEAELMVKKLWRMLIFYSESEKRGLSAS